MADKILVVDDEPVQRRLLSSTLEKLGYEPICVEGGSEAIAHLKDKKADPVRAVLLDLMMPETDGMEVLAQMHKLQLTQPVIVQTAKGGVETAVNAMRAGAVDFVVKPAAPQRISAALTSALKVDALRDAIRKTKPKAKKTSRQSTIVSKSRNMEAVKRIATKAAASDIPVLIEGETGVGKELIAGFIQQKSERATKPFVVVNCGALPENLAESILFGHVKGAFTGASDKHTGKFQEADGGTLFLDEVGELPADIQVKLLRALQQGEIDPVGANKSVKVDVRIISATNRDLLEEVRNGTFREDLYYRLNVLPVQLPPLRERREDIPSLLQHFVDLITAREGHSAKHAIDADAMELLKHYDWPGNIRQLENAIFRAIVLCDGNKLTINEFPQIAMEQSIALAEVDAPPLMTPQTPLKSGDQTGPNHKAEATLNDGRPILQLIKDNGDVVSLECAEKTIMEIALTHYDGNMSTIAKKLGIGRSTLYRKLRDFGLETN